MNHNKITFQINGIGSINPDCRCFKSRIRVKSIEEMFNELKECKESYTFRSCKRCGLCKSKFGYELHIRRFKPDDGKYCKGKI